MGDEQDKRRIFQEDPNMNLQKNFLIFQNNIFQKESHIKIEQKVIQKEPLQPVKYVPLSVDTMLGREEEIKVLYQLIIIEKLDVVLTGMGGIGKTTLSLYCADIWCRDNQLHSIVFLNCENSKTFKSSIMGLAVLLKIPFVNDIKDLFNIILHEFAPHKLLLIYDNIEDVEIVNDFLPTKSQFQNIYIMATSQNKNLQTYFKCFELNVLNIEKGIELFDSVVPKEFKYDKNDLNLLLESLDCLPVAILQMAAHVRNEFNVNKSYTLKKYLGIYKEQLKYMPDYLKTIYKNPAFISIKLNLDKVLKSEDDVAKIILFCLSYMSPNYNYSRLFNQYFSRDIFKSINLLENYSILKLSKQFGEQMVMYGVIFSDHIISIHRLIQEVARSLDELNKHAILSFEILIKFGNSLDFSNHFDTIMLYVNENTLTDYYCNQFYKKYPKERELLIKNLNKLNLTESVTYDWRAIQISMYLGLHKVANVLPVTLTEEKWTILHIATLSYTFKLDFNFSSLLNQQTASGLTALHIASALDKIEFVQELLQIKIYKKPNYRSKCNFDLTDNFGNTALHWAAKYRNFEIIDFLIENGADFTLKNKKNKCFFDCLNENFDNKMEGVIVKFENTFFFTHFEICENYEDFMKEWPTKRDNELFKQLVKLLEYTPFAVKLAVKFIEAENLDLIEILNKIKNTNHEQALKFLNACNNKKFKNIYILLSIIIDTIKEKYFDIYQVLLYSSFWTDFQGHLGYLLSLINFENVIAGNINIEDHEPELPTPYEKTQNILRKYGLFTCPEENHPNILIPDLMKLMLNACADLKNILPKILETILNASCTNFFIRSIPVLKYMSEADILEFYKSYNAPYLNLSDFKENFVKNLPKWSALDHACADKKRGAIFVIQRLVNLNVDINFSENTFTPLDILMEVNNGSDDKLELLERSGAKLYKDLEFEDIFRDFTDCED